MSIETSADVSHIRDEEVLRKMWQDTEDFGKKKEIRSHMYKLREERLKNFYSSDTTNESSQKFTCEKSSKSGTHADSLTDHSFLSLKSKEVRDSESPTRDVHYRITDKAIGGNQGWNIASQNEKVPGGYTTSQVATTSGTEAIDGGVATYSAKCAQKASVFSEGDDRNFVKAFESSTKNVVEQVAKGGDETNSFQSSSSYANSSSKIVSHHQSSSDFDTRSTKSDDSVCNAVVRKTYTSDIPVELQSNPNYVDGNTKVTTETRTLPDGSTVTTTRYEAKYGKTGESKISNTYSSSSSNQKVVQSSTVKSDSQQRITSTSDDKRTDNYQIVQKVPKFVEEQINVTRDVDENVEKVSSTKTQQFVKSDNVATVHQTNETVEIKGGDQKIIRTTQTPQEVEEWKVQKTFTVKNVDDAVQDDRTTKRVDKTTFVKTSDVNQVTSDTTDFTNVKEVTRVTSEPIEEVCKKTPISKPVERKVPDDDQFETSHQEKIVRTTLTTNVDDYAKKDVSKDVKTTQIVEQTNRRISVEVSPTHDAFARSLRAVTPDRDKKHFKASVTSLRSSTSPDKLQPNSRETSPTKRPDRKSPEKFCDRTSTDTFTRHKKVTNEDQFTSVASDIQYITTTNKQKPTTLNFEVITNERHFKTNVGGSPTSPVKPRNKESPTKTKPQDKVFKRRDTYEDRCKQILGITESKESKKSTFVEKSKRKSVDDGKPRKPSVDSNRTSPKKESPGLQEYPAQIRRSSEKNQPQKKQPELKEVKEPPFTKRTINTHCDGDDHHHHRNFAKPSPKKDQPDFEKPHKTVKKDSPYKTYSPVEPSKHPQNETSDDFYIKNTRTDTNTYETEYTTEYSKTNEDDYTVQKQPTPTKRRSQTPQKETPREPSPILTVKKEPVNRNRGSPVRVVLTADVEERSKINNSQTITKKDVREAVTSKVCKKRPTVEPKESREPTTSDEETPTNKVRSEVNSIYSSTETNRFDTYVVPKEKTPKSKPTVSDDDDEPLIDIDGIMVTVTENQKNPRVTERIGSETLIEVTENVNKYEQRTTKVVPTKGKPRESPLRNDKPNRNKNVKTGPKENVEPIPNKNTHKVTTTVHLGKIALPTSPSVKKQKPSETTESVRRINKVNTQQTRKSIDRATTGVTEYTDKYCTVTVRPKEKDRKTTKLNISELQPLIVSPSRKTPEKVTKKTILEVKPQSKKTPEKTLNTHLKKTETKTSTFTRQTPKRDVEPEKRHVVTTTIRVQPKSKPEEPKTKVFRVHLGQSKTVNNKIDVTNKKITRTTSQKTIKASHPTPVRGQSKPELLSPSVITTKSVTVNDELDENKEVIINFLRSTSSRESTPNRICPVLDGEETGVERYPDEILEPSEPSRKPTRLADLSTTTVTTVETINKVDETDQSLLSVNEKVSKFSNNVSLNQLNKNLSPPSIPQRPKSPKCENYSDDETFTSVSDKISRFIETAENVQHHKSTKDRPKSRPQFTNLSDEIKTDECLLSVSEKVNKFTKIQPSTEYKTPISLAKMDVKSPPRRLSPERKVSPLGRTSPDRRDSPQRRLSPERRDSPLIRSSPKRCSPQRVLSPDRRVSPERKTSSPGRLSPERRDSPLGRLSPDRRSPPRRLSPEKEYSTKNFLKNEISIESLSVSNTLKTAESTRRDFRKEKSPLRELPNRQSPTRDFPRRERPNKECPPQTPQRKTPLRGTTVTKVSTTDSSTVTSTRRSSSTKETSPRRESPVKEYFTKQTPTKKESPSRTFKKEPSPVTTDCVQIETEEQTFTRTVTPKRDDSRKYQNLSKETSARREIFTKNYDSTPKSGRKTPDSKCTLSSTGRLRSTETMKRAKELFENIARTQTDSKVVTSHVENKYSSQTRRRSSTDSQELKSTRLVGKVNGHSSPTRLRSPDKHSRSPSPKHHSRDRSESPVYKKPHDPSLEDIPHYMWPLNRAPHDKDHERTPSREPSPDNHDKSPSRGSSPERNVPGYMKPLDRQVKSRERSCEKEQKTTILSSESRLKSKFGITLRRTDSGRRVITTTDDGTSSTREIENIFDLNILEVLLEQATTYEQRRKIRAQIRIVKQSIEDKQIQLVFTKNRKEKSPDKYKPNGHVIETKVKKSEYEERRSSSEMKWQTHQVREKSPEKIIKKNNVCETKSVFKTDLKHPAPTTKTIVDEKPSWITQKNLKKPSDVSTIKKSTTVSSRSQTVKSSSSVKEQKPIDLITSGYGVGPTDENGRPLFGLRALRAQNKTDTTKVQGTVVRSHYYSENGQEPTGEVSVTKYSSEPSDFGENYSKDEKGIVSVTTTQKFGSKGTPSYKTLIDTKHSPDLYDSEPETSRTTTRRGSVKELSKKYDETTSVETTKCEKSSGYPKAGLILRSSSFKNDSRPDQTCRRGSSPDQEEMRTVTVQKVSNEGRIDTFLTNKTRITGVQDVITRMKNSDLEGGSDESPEDKEARNLLNKFLGSQVILSGLEVCSSSSSPTITSARRTTTTTTTITKEGEEPTVITRTFTHPITEEELATVWDIETLKLLLERSTEYEERRIIRSRLRDVMAEEKVCDDVVSKSKEEVSERVEGESLLLPLLQGLLDAPENEQTADSGTESGEDLRNGLLIEVQNVLTKLVISLKSDSNEMTPDRRNSLLQLVTRLQSGLGSQSHSGERRSSGSGRFTRRKRQNRHTVGVSSEELEDARKLIEEFRLNDLKSTKVPLQKQHSEGSVLPVTSQLRPFTKTNKLGVKNAVAKPYNSSGNTSQSQSGASSTVDTPTESSELPEYPRISPNLDDGIENHLKRTNVTKKPRPLSEIVLSNKIPSPEIMLSKFNIVPPPPAAPPDDSNPESEVDETCKILPTQTFEKQPVHDYKASVVLKTNPIYSKPEEEFDESKFYNKFNYKKQKMKRANTIDIPKAVVFHESEDDYDSDTSLDKQSFRRNNYYALRGPIRVGRHSVANTNEVPTFEPKTESDKKFMAFINQHNDNFNKNSLWAHQKEQLHSKKDNNWNNRFGNIRTAFEKASTSNPSTPTSNINSARNFWKCAENTAITEESIGGFRAQQARRESEVPKLASPDQANVVRGSLKVDTKGLEKGYKLVPQPLLNKFSHAPTSAFAAIPKKGNFVAPQAQAVFKPIVQPILEPVHKDPVLTGRDQLLKADYNETDSNSSTPLYLYSPKPLLNPQTSANTSPSQTPWANSINKNRIQKLVTSKFENVPPEVPEVAMTKPRRINKNFQTPIKEVPQMDNVVTAPYLVKSADRSNSVKKLSNQFNYNSSVKPDSYSAHTTVKYNDQFLNNYTPQNYSITYTKQPSNYPSPKIQTNVSNEKKFDVESNLRKKFDQKIKDLSKVQNYGEYKKPTRDSYPEYAPQPVQPISPILNHDTPKYQRQVSQESLKEYEAAQTRVMKGPVSHQAVTMQQNAPKSRTQHDMEAAFNLKSVLQKFAQPEDLQGCKIKTLADRKLSIDSAIRKQSKSPLGLGLKSQSFRKSPYEPDINFLVNGNPLSLESTEIIENGESVITSKFHIPVTLSKPQGRDYQQRSPPQQVLSKTESCHQLAQQKSPELFKPVTKSRSTHTLAVPTLQYQAAMTKDEVVQKRRTVEAYFSGGPSPQSLSRTPSDDSLDKIEKEVKQNKSTINRKKTCEKVSTHKQTGGVARSRTLPNIVCPNLLDESRVEESFENLFKNA